MIVFVVIGLIVIAYLFFFNPTREMYRVRENLSVPSSVQMNLGSGRLSANTVDTQILNATTSVTTPKVIVNAGGELCIGSTCIDENDLKHLLTLRLGTRLYNRRRYNSGNPSSEPDESDKTCKSYGYSSGNIFATYNCGGNTCSNTYQCNP